MVAIVSALPRPNRLLAAVTKRDRALILKLCETVELEFGTVVSEPDEDITHVYFPTSAFISLITPEGAAESLEVGLVGNEGASGMTFLLGIDASPLRALVQGGGQALRMSVADFRRAAKKSASFRRIANAYLYVLMSQFAQTAACGRFHRLEARAARWILMTHDRAGSDTFRLTHDFLAKMLGVRRAGVSEAAALIQRRKFIHYRRGVVQVLRRDALEAVSCPCYGALNKTYHQHLGFAEA